MVADRLHTFTDPVSGKEFVLDIGGENTTPYDGTHGVVHDGCERMADVSPELDCFYCPDCGLNGRISGNWFMYLWAKAVRAEEPPDFGATPPRGDAS